MARPESDDLRARVHESAAAGHADVSAQKQRAAWQREARRLRQRENVLAKDFTAGAFGAQGDLRTAVADMLAGQHSSEADLRKEWAQMKQRLVKARQLTGKVKRYVEAGGTGKEYLDALRKAMDSAEAELVSFRASQRTRYEALTREEATLSRELEDMATRFEPWAKEKSPLTAKVRPSSAPGGGGGGGGTSTGGGATPHGSAADPTRTPPRSAGTRSTPGARVHSALAAVPSHLAMPQEVQEIDAAIDALGGATCGWEADDHAQFLAVLAAFATVAPPPPPAPATSGAAAAGRRARRKQSSRGRRRRLDGAGVFSPLDVRERDSGSDDDDGAGDASFRSAADGAYTDSDSDSDGVNEARDAAAFERGLRRKPKVPAKRSVMLGGSPTPGATPHSGPPPGATPDSAGVGTPTGVVTTDPESVGMVVDPAKMTAFVSRAQLRVPGQSPESMEAHYQMYRRHCELLAHKKTAIAKWRAERRRAASAAAGAGDGGDVSMGSPDRVPSLAMAQLSPGAAAARDKARAEEMAAKREQVAAWKAQREIEEAEREAREAVTKARASEAVERRKARQREAQRRAMEDYKAQRAAERERKDESERLLGGGGARSRAAAGSAPTQADLMQRAQAGVAAAAKRRRATERQKAIEAAHAERLLHAAPSAAARKVGRDRERLVRPTAAFVKRTQATADSLRSVAKRGAGSAHGTYVPSAAGASERRGIDYTYGASRRATPSWRAGV